MYIISYFGRKVNKFFNFLFYGTRQDFLRVPLFHQKIVCFHCMLKILIPIFFKITIFIITDAWLFQSILTVNGARAIERHRMVYDFSIGIVPYVCTSFVITSTKIVWWEIWTMGRANTYAILVFACFLRELSKFRCLHSLFL
jgi:hypothetical protein